MGTTTTAPGTCHMEEDVDYWGGKEVDSVEGVDSAEGCCDECALRHECESWTWISGTHKHKDRHFRCHLQSGERISQAWFQAPHPSGLSRLPMFHCFSDVKIRNWYFLRTGFGEARVETRGNT